MKRSALLLAATLIALVVVAQEPRQQLRAASPSAPVLEFTPAECMRANELAVMQVGVQGAGVLRAYFRHVNAIDWCSVDGVNDQRLSRVTLPRFEAGDNIEYFFVLLKGEQILVRSPRVYRASISNECQALWARHNATVFLNCGNATGAAAPTSAQVMQQAVVDGQPPQGSPDRPTQSATGQ